VNSFGRVGTIGLLQAGDTYVLRLGRWAADAGYRLRLVSDLHEAPPPLTTGPAPAIRLRLNGTPVPPPPPPPITQPPAVSAETGPVVVLVSAKGNRPSGQSRGDGVPASVLLGLGAGPLGGANSPGVVPPPGPDVFSRVFSQGPATFALDKFLAPAVVIPVGEYLGADSPPEPAPEPARAANAAAVPARPQLVASLFALWGLVPPAETQGGVADEDKDGIEPVAEENWAETCCEQAPSVLALSLVFAGMPARWIGPRTRTDRSNRELLTPVA